MRKTVIAALLVSASVASAATATMKVGALSFALNNDYQADVTINGQNRFNTLTPLQNCAGTAKYTAKTQKINNTTILKAIGNVIGVSFSSKAKLVIVNYDNDLTAPPYPQYLIPIAPDASELVDSSGMGLVVNGPRVWGEGDIRTMDPYAGLWPILTQTDWVNYDNISTDGTQTDLTSEVWPKSEVFVYDPGLANLTCWNVTGFFSFEEAYCYFCWDTADRVTQGSFTTGTTTTGSFCLGTKTNCGLKGSGTTKFYLTIKFNNQISSNPWIDITTSTWLPPYFDGAKQVTDKERLTFTVAGVVRYTWTIKQSAGLTGAFGTMTMGTANGFGATPYCGTMTGSVTVSETTNIQIPLSCVVVNP